MSHLPDDLALLKQMIQELLASLQERDHELEQVRQRLDLLLRKLYGPRAEKWDPSQPLLFPEMTQEVPAETAPPQEPTPDDDQSNAKPRGTKHGRKKPSANLRRERREHILSETECLCPECQAPRVKIGEQVSEQLDYQPASVFVVEHVRHTYACPKCQGHVVTAAKPEQPIAKGLPGPGLLAQVVVSKYADHLPLHRLERIFARAGLELSRSTMCDWAARVAQLVRPLYDTLVSQALASRVVQTDDTPIRVLDPQGGPARTGRIWTYLGDAAHPYVVFDFTTTREQEGPAEFLKTFTGHLQADAYSGYDHLFKASRHSGAIVEVGCWRTRRRFYDHKDAHPTIGHEALARIRQLYGVEKEIAEKIATDKRDGFSAEAVRQEMRQEKAAPLLTALCHWLKEQQALLLPKNPLREAVDYALNQWQALERYTEQGFLAIDNNAAERALRHIAIGRKNWLFAGSANGGRTAAILFSLLASATRHGIDLFDWLRDVLTRLAAGPPDPDLLASLLPDRWTGSPVAPPPTS